MPEDKKIDDKAKICFLIASEMYDEKLKASLQKLDQDVSVCYARLVDSTTISLANNLIKYYLCPIE